MFKISEFARLSRVSIKTLRFYDERGLLQPAYVDANSGYRYYSAEQLLTMQRIASFKEDGFTLEQIKLFLANDVSEAEVKETLLTKRLELEAKLKEAERQLIELDERLARMERADVQPSLPQVYVQPVEAQLVASIRDVIPRANLCLLINELKQYTVSYTKENEQLVTILWHELNNLHLDNLDNEELVDVEVALPIFSELPENERMKVDYLPALAATASLKHYCDPYSSFCSAMAELGAWVHDSGYHPSRSEPIREIYLTPDQDIYGKERVAELIIPLAINY